MAEDPSHDDHPKRKAVNSYMRYSGLAFELAGLIFISVWLGGWLDEKAGLTTPYITVGLMLLFVVAYFIKLIKSLE